MGKVILWIVIVFVVMLILRAVNATKAARTTRDNAKPPAGGKSLMVQCVECGVYLPQAEAKAGPRGPCCGDDACRERARQTR
jgi:hypothetical protein